MLEPAVDHIDRPVGFPDVEVSEDILASASQCPVQLGELLQVGGQALTNAVDHPAYQLLAVRLLWIPVRRNWFL